MKKRSSSEVRRRLLRWGGWFVLVNAIFFLVLSSRYLAMMEWPETPLSWAYLFSSTLGHFSLLSFLPYGLLFMPLVFFFPVPCFTMLFMVILYTFEFSLLMIDTIVFAQYRFHLSLFYFDMLMNGGNQIIGFSSQTWVLAISGIVMVFFLEGLSAVGVWKKLDRIATKMRGMKMSGARISVALTLLFIGSHLIHIWADAHYDRPVKTLARYYPLLRPATAQKFMTSRGWVASESERKHQILKAKLSSTKGALNYPTEPLRCLPPEEKYNLLMVIIDSWRYDAMTSEITPKIHAFSKKSLTYQKHFSGGNATRIGIFSLFYGLPGTYWHDFESNQRGPVLLETFLKNGYNTGVFASAPLNSPEFDRTVFSAIGDLPLKTPGHSTDERDREITRRWLSWLDMNQAAKSRKPFFGFLFFDSLHGYQYPSDYPRHFSPTWEEANYLLLNNDTDPLPFRNLYNNIAHFQDSLVGEILDDLERRHLLNDTIVIITGDHGQEFNDNQKNYWGHNSNFTRYQTQVPLIIHWPKRPTGSITERTSHMDLPATILSNLFQCTNPTETYSIGRDLFSQDLKPLNTLLMSSYSSYGIVDFEAMQITVKNGLGFYDVYDHHYNELSAGQTGTQAALQAIKDMSRFYR